MDIVIQKTTQELMQEVVDSKVTRTELIDLIVDRVRKELAAERSVLRAAREAAVERFTVTPKEALPLVRAGIEGAKLSIDGMTRWEKGGRITTGYEVSLTVVVPADQLPKKVQQRRAAVKEIDDKLKVVRDRECALNNGKQRARLALVQDSLSSTPEGKRILEAIDALKGVIKERLLSSGGNS